MKKRKRFRRLRCWLGFHDVHPDPDVPNTYWCARPLCRWIVANR